MLYCASLCCVYAIVCNRLMWFISIVFKTPSLAQNNGDNGIITIMAVKWYWILLLKETGNKPQQTTTKCELCTYFFGYKYIIYSHIFIYRLHKPVVLYTIWNIHDIDVDLIIQQRYILIAYSLIKTTIQMFVLSSAIASSCCYHSKKFRGPLLTKNDLSVYHYVKNIYKSLTH